MMGEAARGSLWTKGEVMPFLRFSPEEYHALSDLCQPLNLHRHRPQTLK